MPNKPRALLSMTPSIGPFGEGLIEAPAWAISLAVGLITAVTVWVMGRRLLRAIQERRRR